MAGKAEIPKLVHPHAANRRHWTKRDDDDAHVLLASHGN